ncbi:hypothetical protein [Candidatus Binatus sp.]|jgi:hypothetical protein|uniref:hypothetical protein n=1 Tax=Candidatus Binatus sp. TaxID=2811406 RepID=UPI003CC625F0
MILTVIRDKEMDLQLAGIAATAICGAGLTQPFPGGLPSRGDVADGGSLEVQCDPANAPRVRAGFVAAGFDTIERVADPDIPPKTKIVEIAVGPENQEYLQMADPATDALCGAGLTVAYPDGKSYSGDLSTDATVNVQCDQIDAAVVQQAFSAVWQMLQSG